MEERKGFGSNFRFLMAAVGSAVGLGNIWGFPNKMGASGGFTFLIIYLILAVLCGFIVMVGELAIGRKTGHGAVGAYKALSKKFKWMGWLGILSAFFILFFYCALGGYCIKYTVLNIGDLFGAGFGSNGLSGGEIFGNFLGSPVEGCYLRPYFRGADHAHRYGRHRRRHREGLLRGYARPVRGPADLHHPRLHPGGYRRGRADPAGGRFSRGGRC